MYAGPACPVAAVYSVYSIHTDDLRVQLSPHMQMTSFSSSICVTQDFLFIVDLHTFPFSSESLNPAFIYLFVYLTCPVTNHTNPLHLQSVIVGGVFVTTQAHITYHFPFYYIVVI